MHMVEGTKTKNMKLFLILAVCIALTYGRVSSSKSLPKCLREDPNLIQCILSRVEMIRPYLKTGIPELNIPRLEPFKMRKLDLDAELPGLLLKGEATNIVAYGASGFQIKSLKLDLDNYFLEIHVTIPRLEITADYDSTGSRIFLFETSGSGQFKGTFTGVSAVVSSNGHAVIKNGLEYVKIDDVSANIKFGSGTLHVDPDNRSFKAKTGAKLINRNSRTILKKMGPVINKVAAPVIKKYLSKILNVVPLNDILSW